MVRNMRPVTAGLLAVLTLWFPAGAGAQENQLSPGDRAALIYHLNLIANDPGWPQPSVDAANAILSDLTYTAVAWDAFFTEYFSSFPFTERLYNYLPYPVFHWFGDGVHQRLQMGLDGPLMLVNVEPDWAAAIAGPGTAFAADPVLRHDLFYSQNLLAQIGRGALLPVDAKQALFDGLRALIDRYPTVLRRSVTLDRAARPYFATLRMQTFVTLVAAAPVLDGPTKAQIAATLDLTGVYAALWQDCTCLLLENNYASLPQQQFIYSYLSLVPPGLHNTVSITINDFLGNGPPFQERSYNPWRPYGGVNVGSMSIGASSENSFPPDVPSGWVDVYCVIVAHEINHVVNAYTIEPHPVRGARQNALLAAARCARMNYLRSMFPDCTFVNAPQEFFASIANQWFTDSQRTLDLGLVRFNAGYLHPINQALFFAEVYSLGGNSTLAYRITPGGVMRRETVPLRRDANGRINQLTLGGLRYAFELDPAGNVTTYTVTAACRGDLEGDEAVGLSDLAILLSSFGHTSGTVNGDLDRDGDVDLADLAVLLSVFGTICE